MTEADTDLAGRECLSDLMDGRLLGDDRVKVLRAVAVDRQNLEAWATYHLIGDALRSGELAVAGDDALFADRVRLRIEASYSVEAGGEARTDECAAEQPGNRHERFASNQPTYRLVAGGLGAVALAAVVAWFVAGWPALDGGGSQLAGGVPPNSMVPPSDSSSPPVMIRDPRLDELLAAHKQSGALTALQRPAGFLRNAAFDEGPSK